MAPTKRPATSAAGPKTKKAKGPSVAKQCKEISSAMKGAEGYPPLVVKMISENLAVCLGDYKEERHEFQASVASMAEKILASIKVSIEAKIKESEETLAKADTEKAAREAAVEETKKLAEDSTAACAAAKQEVTTTEAELKKAQEELKTAEKEQKAGDAQSVKDETKKGKLENTINAVFVPCKEGALEKAAITKGISELQKLGKEALNEDNEDEEAAGRGLTRVDNCIQLARALPPGRLMDVFHSKLAEGNDKDEDAGALRKLLEGRDAGGWQRPPGPQELTADADEPVPAMQSLKGLFSCTTNVVHGSYLRETTSALLRRLERSSHASGGVTLAELRLPLHAEGDAWVDLARWASDLGSLSSRACWVVQLPVTSYAALKGRRAILDYGELLDNAFGPLVKLVTEEPHGEVWLKLQELLHHVVAFELSACLAVTEPLNGEVPEPSEWNESHSPPLAYQFYHLWARLKGLNCARARSKQKELGLRAAASSPEALACAYLLGASSVSGCGSLSSHLPLQYLYMLDQVGVAVSQCSKRSLGEAGALQKLFTHSLRVALCTEDPAVSHWSDDPLGQEYGLAHSAGFSNADLAELARNSQWISSFESFAREEENVEEQEAMGLRARYRRAQRQEEIEFLSSLIPDKDQNHL